MKNLDDMDIKVAVKTIGILPSLLLSPSIKYSENETKLIKSYEFFFQGLEVWLENLSLKQSLNPAAVETNWKHFQGYAAMDAALLDLISGLHPRVASLQEAFSGKEAPSAIWLMALYINTANTLKESGLILEQDSDKRNFLGKPFLVGKNDIYLDNIAVLNKSDEQIQGTSEKIVEKKLTPRIYEAKDCLISYLQKVAVHEAIRDSDFDSQYWKPYYKTISYWTRKIRDNKVLQAACLLPNGDLFVTGSGKKIPKSIKPTRGFG